MESDFSKQRNKPEAFLFSLHEKLLIMAFLAIVATDSSGMA